LQAVGLGAAAAVALAAAQAATLTLLMAPADLAWILPAARSLRDRKSVV